MSSFTENPYRFLFPIGCLNGILGASLWVAFSAGWITVYPASHHANLMVGGFLLSYAIGFLWTAIPRFLRAPSASPTELTLLITLLGLTPVLGLISDPLPFDLTVASAILLTLRFGRNRFRLRRNNPPPSFLYVFLGMILAILSLLVLATATRLPLPAALEAFARIFFLKGFFLCLVLGVGLKLIPALLGWGPLPTSEEKPGPAGIVLPLLTFTALLLGLGLEALGLVRWSGPMISLAILLPCLRGLHLMRIPKTKSALSFSVWASSWAIALFPLSLAFFPAYAVHFWHLIFISGFGLLTVFVSLRVVLAHSGQEFIYWEKKPALFALAGLILLATFTRVSAPFFEGPLMLAHYAYGASLWILALTGWLWVFFRFTPLFRKNAL